MRYLSLKLLFILLLAVQFSPGLGLTEETPELESLTGIPVMAGLSENTSERIVFDKPEGRIIHTTLAGDVTSDQVLTFYRETLFQLGWVMVEGPGPLTFYRDQERLTLTIIGPSPLELIIDLRPTS